jgi:hypothetical protein
MGAESRMTTAQDLDPEDAKIITLARSARARNGAESGAAVRDTTGRTYAATPVSLPSLRLSALEVAVAMAVSSGAEALEAAAIVSGDAELTREQAAAALDLKADAVFLAAPDGRLVARI